MFRLHATQYQYSFTICNAVGYICTHTYGQITSDLLLVQIQETKREKKKKDGKQNKKRFHTHLQD